MDFLLFVVLAGIEPDLKFRNLFYPLNYKTFLHRFCILQ